MHQRFLKAPIRNLALAGLAVVALNATAFAQLTTYSGRDAGVGPAGTPTNTNNAIGLFTTATASGTTTLVTFENLAVGNYANPLNLGGGVSVSTTGFAGPVAIANSSSVVDGYNTTAGGSNFLRADTTSNQNSIVFTFNPGVYAFGATFTGAQVNTGTLFLSFNDGTNQQYNLDSYIANSTGGIGFFGFSDIGKTIASVSLNITGSGTNGNPDIFGVDDLRVVRASVAAVPEPGEYAIGFMFAGTLGMLAMRARGRTQSARIA